MVFIEVAVLALALGVSLTVRMFAEPRKLVPSLLVVAVITHVFSIVFTVNVRATKHAHSPSKSILLLRVLKNLFRLKLLLRVLYGFGFFAGLQLFSLLFSVNELIDQFKVL